MATIQKRVANDGSTSYRVQIRLKGQKPETATFNRITDAKRWAAQTEAAIREGRYFKATPARKQTLADLIDRYILEVLPTKPLSQAKQTMQLTWWKEQLGVFVLTDVTPARIAECRNQLLQGTTYRHTQRSPATAVRYLAALSHAFTIAMKEWGWVEDNPVRKVARPREPQGRLRFLSEAEQVRLLSACRADRNPDLFPVVVLAISTGMRRSEVLKLRWRDLDLEQARILLGKTKNKQRRFVPLLGTALKVLQLRARDNTSPAALVFPGKKNPLKPADVRKAWDRAIAVAELQDFLFHDLRHCTGSYLAMSGASASEIAAVLGHETLSMVKRYAHVSDPHTVAVMERMSRKFLDFDLDGKSTKKVEDPPADV